jgi:protein-L-isoaspartate(D-aspartate) O-methyltransferase
MNFDYRRAQLVMALRSIGVTDTSVMGAIESIPREIFVPSFLRQHAYEDATLPIGYEQTLSQPSVVGIMTQALCISDRMKVLEVGTGSGYQTAILAKLARRVYTIERFKPLMVDAEARFKDLKISNITTKCGDGTFGWKEQTPFDRIVVTAASLDVPPILASQLAIGGLMVVPIGVDAQSQKILKVTKKKNGLKIDDLRDVNFVPLIPSEVIVTK